MEDQDMRPEPAIGGREERSHAEQHSGGGFTPGPWFVDYEPVGDEPDLVSGGGGITGYEPTGDLLAADGRIVPRTEANELLKAAAPDLLEALQAMTYGLPELLESIGYADEEDMRGMAARAIAKATGGAK